MSEGRERVTRRSEQRGQSLVLVVISLTVLLGMAALVLDLGLGWYAKRQLQASVDAAALAGAQELPSSANAVGPRARVHPEESDARRRRPSRTPSSPSAWPRPPAAPR